MAATTPTATPVLKPKRFNPLTALGPGLITGAADEDPGGVATHSQAGAQFGVDMLWTAFLTYPFMAAFQSVCGQIGRVTGKGLATNMKAAFPPWVVRTAVVLLLVANTLNIAADVASMGEAAQLVFGGNRHVYTIGLAVFSLLLQVFVPYHRYVGFLKWMTLSLLAYVAVAFTVHVQWLDVLNRSLLPHITLDVATATVVVAVFGPRSVPTSSSGRPPRKWRTSRSTRPPTPCWNARKRLRTPCGGSSGTPISAWPTPTASASSSCCPRP